MIEHRVLDPKAKFRVRKKLCALGIMTKATQAGKVKTRLTPPLTAEEAAELNICFLRDLAESIARACSSGGRRPPNTSDAQRAPLQISGTGARGVGIYTPIGAESTYENILPQNFFLIPQRGDDFGERLVFAAEDLFRVGFESVCLINSDSPTVPASAFAEAVNELGRAGDRAVLGPSDDGGYYLIGLKKLHKRLFQEIDWSTERVFEQTKQRAAEIGVGVYELPRGFDVDDRTTLHKLCDELLGSERSGVAPDTSKFLRSIVEQEGRDRIWPR